MLHADTKWIWLKKQEEPDEYASFVEKFVAEGGSGKIVLEIAAEINYIAYVNGRRAGFGQFPGYKNEKYYDEIDITGLTVPGENELRIVARYEGLNTLGHIADRAGVIFEVTCGDELLCQSTSETPGGLDTDYQQHVCRLVTWQLGYSTDMRCGGEIEYDTCREVELSYNLKKRPVKKLVEEPLVYGERLDIPGKEIYDFGRETVGHLVLTVCCEQESEIVLAYGEHLKDGCVRQRIGIRDFSVRFAADGGRHTFEQLFLRVAGRYVEVFRTETAKIESVAILPVMYPVEENDRFLTGVEEKIYDVSVRTLRLCMHEHYEDCPWREQALYVMDSRNQMLCGYYAFKDPAYARANIVFMAKGKREDGLLELTYPAVNTPAIPFFSIMYPVVVLEYIEHTGDTTILDEVMPTVKGIMDMIAGRTGEDGLLNNLPAPYWNFYEWSEGSDALNDDRSLNVDCDPSQCDLILNCSFVYAAERYRELCALREEPFGLDLDAMKKAIADHFYDAEKGMYFLSNRLRNLYGQLGNAFAKLIGLRGENLEAAVRGENGVVPATLSMTAFVYDALLESGKGNRKFVLDDIRKKYGYMLDCGATSFWETVDVDGDFAGAGSLCHGWSAIPVYYYHKLLK